MTTDLATLFGCTVPIAGWSKVTEFQQKTGIPLQLVRVYPGPRVLEASLASVRKCVSLFPDAAICFNPHVAGRGFTTTQLSAFVKAIEVEAAKVPGFWLVPDAEPDRTDRRYSTDQFCASFTTVAELVALHAPHVEMSLNLTGYDFLNRIRRYRSVKPLYQVLSLDPYWQARPGAVQGTTKDLDVAVYWAAMNHKRLALAEWGAESGPGQAERLTAAFGWINANEVAFSGYYIEDGDVPIRGALDSPESFAAYEAGVSL